MLFVNVFAQKSLLSLISPVILEMPPPYLAWFHNTGVSSPKNSRLLDQGKRTLRGEAVQALLTPSRYECGQPYQELRDQQKTWELLQYRADHCTKISYYFTMIQRETLITSRWRNHRMRQWWRVCSVGDPRWWKFNMKLCRHLNMTQSWSLLRRETWKKLGLTN